MGGFPALMIRPPESPVQQVGGALAIQEGIQRQQLGEIQLQEARLNQTSQQELMAAFARNNGDLNQTYSDAVSSGKVTPQMLNQFRQQSVAIQTQMATLDEKNLANLDKANGLFANELESFKALPVAQRTPDAVKAAMGRLAADGVDISKFVPQFNSIAQDPSDTNINNVETSRKGLQWLLANEKAQREKEQAPSTPEVIAERQAKLAETESATLKNTNEASLALERQHQLGKVTDADVYREQQANYRATLARQTAFANELQKNGISQLDKMFSDPQHGYIQFVSQAQSTKNTIMQSQNGSQLASSMEPLMLALGVTSFAGIHRINQTEVNSAGPQAGSLYRRLNTILDKAGSGSVPEDTLKEASSIVDALIDAKHSALINGANMVAANGGLDPKRTMVMDRSGVLTTLDKALTESGKTPETQIAPTTIKPNDPLGIR